MITSTNELLRSEIPHPIPTIRRGGHRTPGKEGLRKISIRIGTSRDIAHVKLKKVTASAESLPDVDSIRCLERVNCHLSAAEPVFHIQNKRHRVKMSQASIPYPNRNTSEQQLKKMADQIEDPITLAEIEQLAKKKLPCSTYDFYAGGADDEIVLRRNINIFSSWVESFLAVQMNIR